MAFLDKLGQLRSMQAMNMKTTRLMNGLYGFDASGNSEIKLAWYKLCIKAGNPPLARKKIEGHCLVTL